LPWASFRKSCAGKGLVKTGSVNKAAIMEEHGVDFFSFSKCQESTINIADRVVCAGMVGTPFTVRLNGALGMFAKGTYQLLKTLHRGFEHLVPPTDVLARRAVGSHRW